MVPDNVAREHHQIVAHSDLIIFDASHFMLFPKDAKQLANEVIGFLTHHHEPNAASQRRLVDDDRFVDDTDGRANLPIVLKPYAAERGFGLQLACDFDAIEQYLN